MSVYKGDTLIAGGDLMRTKVIWINSSPTSSFVGQVIVPTLANPIDFDFLYIEFYNAEYGNRYASLIFQPDNTNYEMNCVHSTGSNVFVWYRPVKATTNLISFGDCWRGTNGNEGKENNACIPVKIIGIKTLKPDDIESNVNDTVVEEYRSSDGLTWYRKWASGWKECGGKTNTSSSNYKYVNLPITFSDTSYTAIGSFADNSGYPLRYTRVQSVNGIDMECSSSGTKYMYYYCCGY